MNFCIYNMHTNVFRVCCITIIISCMITPLKTKPKDNIFQKDLCSLCPSWSPVSVTVSGYQAAVIIWFLATVCQKKASAAFNLKDTVKRRSKMLFNIEGV